ncbi:MAG: M48 family metallopeptidase [Bacteroidota bacterium]
MRRIHFSLALVGALVFALLSCHRVPITNRAQTRLIPASQINSLSFEQYSAFLQQNPPVSGSSDVDRVRRIGQRLVKAVEVYYRANELGGELQQFQWEFNVVQDELVNAFCMPGGKVVIYTGILPVAQTDDGLAVVMGHEIAHALAHHGNERMTHSLGLNGALTVIDAALAVNTAQSETVQQAQQREQARQYIMAAAGIGAQVGITLPFSRKHESEADRIGLILMAIAGFDVDAAAPFWQRMQAQGGEAPPEFLSTHPHPETRADNLNKWAAEAREYGQKYSIY